MSDEIKNESEIRPICRYSEKEIRTIIKALKDISKFENNMFYYNIGFKTAEDANRSRSIKERIDNCCSALNEMCTFDIHDDFFTERI